MNHSIDEPTPVRSRRRSPRKALAFTLVEMLVVMAVIILILGITLPVFKSLLGGRGVEKSIDSVTGVIELARASAIANQSCVWVLFKNATNSDNSTELQCAALISISGLNDNKPPNLKALTGLIRVSNVKNVQFSELPQAVKDIAPADIVPSDTVGNSFIAATGKPLFPSSFLVAGQDFNGAPFFCLNADGEIATSGDTYNMLFEPQVCLGLVETRGAVVLPNAHDGAVITVYGGSARTRINRP